MTPSETAFTRRPRAAYSIASDPVTATNPPLVSVCSALGLVLSAYSTNVVETLTMWPAPRSSMWDHPRRDVEEAEEVDGDQGVEILEGVVGEGFGDVDTGVVDQGVDPAEESERLLDDATGRVGVGDVPGHGHG